MTQEVEEIIKSKTYFELTDEELVQVSEFAQNEEEFIQMKWFLTATGEAMASEKIEAPKQLKAGVMKHLAESRKQKGFWLNSVGGFLLPEGKPVYRKPAVQLAVAASLIIGLVLFFNPKDKFQQQEMAEVEPGGNTILPDQSPVKTDSRIIQPEQFDSSEITEKNEVAEPEKLLENNLTSSNRKASVPQQMYEINFEDAELDLEKEQEAVSPVKDQVMADNVEEEFDEYAGLEKEELRDKSEKKVFYSADSLSAERFVEVDAIEEYNAGVVETNKTADVQLMSAPEATTINAEVTSSGNFTFNLKSKQIESADNVIIPKELHIDQTKELETLFFTVK